jgi:flagellar motor switch protein FliN/FliY
MSTPDRLSQIVPALASELGDAVAALLGESTTTTPILNGGEAGWIAAIVMEGALQGEVTVGLSDEDVRRVAQLVTGEDGSPSDDTLLDTLREICAQAVGAISQKEVAAGVRIAVTGVTRASTPAVEAEHAFEFPLRGTPVRLFVHAALDETPQPAQPPPASGATAAVPTQNLEVLLDVELPVSVRFGQTELPLQALMQLGPGSVVDLHRGADEPVDVLVSGKVIARGEVVVVEGNYGVRVLQIVSAAERIRSLGA